MSAFAGNASPSMETTLYPVGNPSADIDARTAEPPHRPGEVALGTQNTTFLFVQSGAACATGATRSAPVAVAVDPAAFSVADGSGWFSTAPFKANEYGWVYKKNT
jgi:hypothetical protein